jgi:hypothetical protein
VRKHEESKDEKCSSKEFAKKLPSTYRARESILEMDNSTPRSMAVGQLLVIDKICVTIWIRGEYVKTAQIHPTSSTSNAGLTC